jgi:hypothetical protein
MSKREKRRNSHGGSTAEIIPGFVTTTTTPSPTSVEAFMKSWKQKAAVDSNDECTAPTFLSVDSNARVEWADDEGTQNIRTSKLGEDDPPPPITSSPTSAAATAITPRARGGASVTAADGETRRRLHHKERLRWLTGRFASGSATAFAERERTRRALSTTVPAADAEDTGENDVIDADGTGTARDDSDVVGRAFDCIGRMSNSCGGCSLAWLMDDDDTYHEDHEGKIIGIPIKKDHGGVTTRGRSSDSDISSVTGNTPNRFQRRYPPENVSDGIRWYGDEIRWYES